VREDTQTRTALSLCCAGTNVFVNLSLAWLSRWIFLFDILLVRSGKFASPRKAESLNSHASALLPSSAKTVKIDKIQSSAKE